MSDYVWLIELLAGMLLGFYTTSSKFREVVNHYIFRRNRQPSIEEQIETAELLENEVDATTFAEYLKLHPDITIKRNDKL